MIWPLASVIDSICTFHKIFKCTHNLLSTLWTNQMIIQLLFYALNLRKLQTLIPCNCTLLCTVHFFAVNLIYISFPIQYYFLLQQVHYVHVKKPAQTKFLPQLLSFHTELQNLKLFYFVMKYNKNNQFWFHWKAYSI